MIVQLVKKLSCLFWTPNSGTKYPDLSHNPVYTFAPYFVKILLNIAIQSAHVSQVASLSLARTFVRVYFSAI
jgi:hypothetical protein